MGSKTGSRPAYQHALSVPLHQAVMDLLTGHRDDSMAMLNAQYADFETLERENERVSYTQGVEVLLLTALQAA
jgi:hypothetical protein